MEEEQQVKKLTKEQFFTILKVSPDEVLTIGWTKTRDIIVLTKKNMERIKYDVSEGNVGHLLLSLLPESFEFLGFQHSEEGVSFDAFGEVS